MANWTNNNCESLNHIMKLDANWKVKNTPALIRMLHDMLHFKDLKWALYGDGNYRLYGKYKRYLMQRSEWKNLGGVDQGKMFSDFLKDRKSPRNGKTEYIVSTYSNFRVPSCIEHCQKTWPKFEVKLDKDEKLFIFLSLVWCGSK